MKAIEQCEVDDELWVRLETVLPNHVSPSVHGYLERLLTHSPTAVHWGGPSPKWGRGEVNLLIDCR